MLRDDRGMTLIEVLVAMAIVFILFLGMSSGGILVLDQNIKNSQRDAAVNVAEEVLQQMRDSGLRRHRIAGTASRYPPVIRGMTQNYTVSRTAEFKGSGTSLALLGVTVLAGPGTKKAGADVHPFAQHHCEAMMKRREKGFSILELLIAMAIVMIVLYSAITFFVISVNQYKAQTKITASNLEGILGLELLRRTSRTWGSGFRGTIYLPTTRRRPGS